jgi:hypothetical protein
MVSRAVDSLSAEMAGATIRAVPTAERAQKHGFKVPEVVGGSPQSCAGGPAKQDDDEERTDDVLETKADQGDATLATTQAVGESPTQNAQQVIGLAAWQAARKQWTRPSTQGRLPIRK